MIHIQVHKWKKKLVTSYCHCPTSNHLTYGFDSTTSLHREHGRSHLRNLVLMLSSFTWRNMLHYILPLPPRLLPSMNQICVSMKVKRKSSYDQWRNKWNNFENIVSRRSHRRNKRCQLQLHTYFYEAFFDISGTVVIHYHYIPSERTDLR